MLTIEEIKTILKEQYDEILILELLGINAEDLVEAFTEQIENRYDQLNAMLELELGNNIDE